MRDKAEATCSDETAWLDYWQQLPEDALLFPQESEEFVERLVKAIPLQAESRILDFGCGTGGIAKQLLMRGQRVVEYWDATPLMLERADRQLRSFSAARCWNQKDGDFDLILVNSVVQYLSTEKLLAYLTLWAKSVVAGGMIVVSDLLMDQHRMLNDMVSLFRFSLSRGYLLEALKKTLAEQPRYRSAHADAPLFKVNAAWLEEAAFERGLSVNWLPENLTHFTTRKTAVLTRAI